MYFRNVSNWIKKNLYPVVHVSGLWEEAGEPAVAQGERANSRKASDNVGVPSMSPGAGGRWFESRWC